MITKERVVEITESMINESVVAMKKNLCRLVNEGVLPLNEYEDNNTLPRIIMNALLKEELFQFKPLYDTKACKKEIERIYASI